jgi:hypothetical protein
MRFPNGFPICAVNVLLTMLMREKLITHAAPLEQWVKIFPVIL